MLCTTCNTVIHPVVAVDIDGTLAQYHETFLGFARHYFNRPLPTAWSGQGDWEEYLGLTRAEYREAKLAFRQGGFKRWMPAFPDVMDLLRRLREEGVEVWLCSTRPWAQVNNIDPDTQEWLRRHNFTPDGLLYGDDKYMQLVEAVDPRRVVAVLDDLREQCQIAENLGLPAMQVARVHNRLDQYFIRLDFSVAVARAARLAAGWYENQEVRSG